MREFIQSVLAFVLLCTSNALCQQGTLPPQSQVPQSDAKRDWRVIWRNVTVALGEVAHDSLMNRDYFHALGTAVLISTGEHSGYLVTARHMFCDPEKKFHPSQLRMRFAWQEHKSIYDYLGVPLNLRSDSGANLWTSLEDDTDLAAIAILQTDEVLPPDDRLKMYDSIALGDVISDVYEGEPVLILGYPGFVGNEKLVRAIVRQGIVAWTNPNQPDQKTFLVDANLYPGNSGGPVIKVPFGMKEDGSYNFLGSGALKLLGLVSQAPVEDIKTVVSNPRLGQVETHTSVIGIGAIGIIEPGSRIHKLIETMGRTTTKVPPCDVPDPVRKQPTAR